MIELQHVSKSYNGKIQAVDHIDLSVERGEIFGFLGPNGAGKTTTIKMITGILEPDTGTIQVNGHDIGGMFDLDGPNTPPGTPPCIGVMVKVDSADAMRLSARGYTRMLRVARTIADLGGAETVGRIHVAEALSYRRQPPRA